MHRVERKVLVLLYGVLVLASPYSSRGDSRNCEICAMRVVQMGFVHLGHRKPLSGLQSWET